MSPCDEDDPVVDVGEALAVARVGEQVVGDDVVVRVPLEPVADEVRADESGRAGDEDAAWRSMQSGAAPRRLSGLSLIF